MLRWSTLLVLVSCFAHHGVLAKFISQFCVVELGSRDIWVALEYFERISQDCNNISQHISSFLNVLWLTKTFSDFRIAVDLLVQLKL